MRIELKNRLSTAKAKQEKEEFQPRTLNTEDLDIPTFLRNRVRS